MKVLHSASVRNSILLHNSSYVSLGKSLSRCSVGVISHSLLTSSASYHFLFINSLFKTVNLECGTKSEYYFVINTRCGTTVTLTQLCNYFTDAASKVGVDEIGQLVRAFAAAIEFCVWLSP